MNILLTTDYKFSLFLSVQQRFKKNKACKSQQSTCAALFHQSHNEVMLILTPDNILITFTIDYFWYSYVLDSVL